MPSLWTIPLLVVLSVLQVSPNPDHQCDYGVEGCQGNVGTVDTHDQCEDIFYWTQDWKRSVCGWFFDVKNDYFTQKRKLNCPATGSFMDSNDMRTRLEDWCDRKEDCHVSDRSLVREEKQQESSTEVDAKVKTGGTPQSSTDGSAKAVAKTPQSSSESDIKAETRTPDPISYDFENLSIGLQKGFMTVEEILRKVLSDQTYRQSNSIVVYNDINQLLNDKRLGGLAKKMLKTNPPKLWRSLQLVDGCCPMYKFLTPNKTMINIDGLERRIVHFEKTDPPKYQFIQHGICTPDAFKHLRSEHHTCGQGHHVMPLLVWDTNYNPPYTFDLFQIPSHCTCYNGT